MMATLVALASLGNMYDIVMPSYLSGCSNGCMAWDGARLANYSHLWADGVPKDAGSSCAMPAAQAGKHECDCGQKDAERYMTDSYAGPWCFCNAGATKNMSYCSAPKSHVEQLNLQVAAPDTIVASFVTYEALPAGPPVAMLSTSPLADGGAATQLQGVSHSYSFQPKPCKAPAVCPAPNRTYIMHYVKFPALSPRTRYYYKVKSGSSACGWTEQFSFRSGYADGVTRLATYGDMAHEHFNNMGNMLADCKAGTIDAIVHMGDHAYDLGYSGDRRGDAYMNALQPLLASCPWYPIVGNHEADDGDEYNRYMAIAWGEEYGNDPPTKSSATTALGHLLGKGTMYSSVHNAVPSNTSRYTATDYGLIHIAGIDLMNFDPKQAAWFEADLKAAAANREKVPWIMATAHIPLYSADIAANLDKSAAHFLGEEGEHEIMGQPLPTQRYEPQPDGTVFMQPAALPPHDGHLFAACPAAEPDCLTVGQWQAQISNLLEPLLVKYGVDIFNAGHVHSYTSMFPMVNGSQVGTDFTNPRAPVHIVEGNGGVPGTVSSAPSTLKPCTAKYSGCRNTGTGSAYGRMTAWNATHLSYDHVANMDGKVMDSFTIVQTKHGPFAGA